MDFKTNTLTGGPSTGNEARAVVSASHNVGLISTGWCCVLSSSFSIMLREILRLLDMVFLMKPFPRNGYDTYCICRLRARSSDPILSCLQAPLFLVLVTLYVTVLEISRLIILTILFLSSKCK